MARQRIAIPFGSGLDRYSGPLVVDPSAQEDVRNVHLDQGWAHVRKGATVVGEAPIAIVAGAQLRAEDVLLLVGYDSSSREVKVYRTASDGSGTPTAIGTWFELAEDATEPPRVFLAEVAGRMFLAHDEPIFLRRAPTVYYSPGAGNLEPLTADWAHEGGISFRGVTAHLGVYLAGWGYGDLLEHRPDLVRMSLPGEPTVFDVRYYEPIGERGEAVLRCVSTPSTLLCFTAGQVWEHYGSDQATFGARPLDKNFGLASSRLAIELDGVVYFWSRTGPRRIAGGLSEDLALPLELRGPAPADLVAEGALEHGFATFYPPESEVLFVFGRRIYAYSLRTGRWRYDELPWAPTAAIVTQPGLDVDVGYLPGIVSGLQVTDDVADGLERKLTFKWTNEFMIGDEILELWADDGDGWALVASVPVETQEEQNYTLAGFAAGTEYTFQLRARRAGMYRPEYMDSDPDTWPSGSRVVYATGLEAPAIVSTTWERTSASSERILVTVEPYYEDVTIELIYGGQVVATATPPHSGQVVLEHVDPAGEQTHAYRVRHRTSATEGALSAERQQWAGPDHPLNVTLTERGVCVYDVDWNNAVSSGATEIEDDYPDGVFRLHRDVPYPGSQAQVVHGQAIEDCAGLGGEMIPVTVRVRHRVTSFGVDDWSQWVFDATSLCSECGTVPGGGN